MEDSTSDDDYVTRVVSGGGKFRKFMASEDEGSIPSLADVQHLEDPNEEVKFGCFRMKRAVKHELVVAVLMAIVICAGAGNSVASRVKGQAMGPFNFFTSLGNSIMYVSNLFCGYYAMTRQKTRISDRQRLYTFRFHTALFLNLNLRVLFIVDFLILMLDLPCSHTATWSFITSFCLHVVF